MTCCNECYYPNHPGVCVRRFHCPCHDTELSTAPAPTRSMEPYRELIGANA